MFNTFLANYQNILVNFFGYEFAVHLEEVILVLAGIFIGIFIMALLAGNFILKLYSIEDFGESKIKMIRIDHGSKSKYIIYFKTFSEAVEQVLLLSFSPFFTIKRFTKRDELRTRRFLIFMFILAFITICFAFLSICTVFKSI